MSRHLRVGLLGAGRVGAAVHLEELRRNSAVDLVAIADVDPRTYPSIRHAAPRARIFASYQEMLDSAEIDAAVVCLPTHLHAEAAIQAFDRAVDVYLEKPIATSLEEADRVVRSWKRSGRVGMIGFNSRFHPLISRAKALLQQGVVGEVQAAFSVSTSPKGRLPDWKRRRSTGGGALLDLASHHVDLLPHLLNRQPLTVSAVVQSRYSQADVAQVDMTLTGDILTRSFFSLRATRENRLVLYGDRARLEIDRVANRLWLTRRYDLASPFQALGDALLETPARLWRLIRSSRDPSYATALRLFTESSQTGNTPSVDLQDGYRSLAIVLAAERSAERGRPVRLAAE